MQSSQTLHGRKHRRENIKGYHRHCARPSWAYLEHSQILFQLDSLVLRRIEPDFFSSTQSTEGLTGSENKILLVFKTCSWTSSKKKSAASLLGDRGTEKNINKQTDFQFQLNHCLNINTYDHDRVWQKVDQKILFGWCSLTELNLQQYIQAMFHIAKFQVFDIRQGSRSCHILIFSFPAKILEVIGSRFKNQTNK